MAVVLEVTPEAADAAAAYLIDHGAPGIVEEERAGRTRVTGHFRTPPPRDDVARFVHLLSEQFPGSTATVRYETVPEANWKDSWKAHFAPVATGKRLYVHPPWTQVVPPGRIGIRIEPGMAFGTGQHATTRGCLEALERLAEAGQLGRVLDLGTGSGVLAIAAARLGAAAVVAVDTDPEAVAAARENVSANACADRVVVCDSLPADAGLFDLVMANILLDTLVRLGRDIRRALASSGRVVASGITADQVPTLVESWSDCGLEPDSLHVIDDWATAIFAVSSPVEPR